MAEPRATTLEELEAIPREFLTCKQIAPILGAKEENIHHQATDAPQLLGFPVVVIRSRVKIPKRPFIRFMRDGVRE
jgi:hypothetical protein